jgi:hypothetical protein
MNLAERCINYLEKEIEIIQSRIMSGGCDVETYKFLCGRVSGLRDARDNIVQTLDKWRKEDDDMDSATE